ncbi:MAG: RnfABCDGE type electron transport complex subunit A [Oscillospiraceae bacterium]|jgi:electron transport complex protein RnfA|nr:RnfABCDGE type electron transport complex subunit A [Oscillospiraceae bacterium]
MKELMVILFSAILTQNFVLSKFMGICPFLGVSKKMNSAVGMSAAVTFVMVAASAITWPIYTYLLAPFSLEYLSKVVFILIIALFVQLVEILIKKYAKSLYNALGVYLPLITTNCAVLGVTILNVEDQLTFLQAVINALGGGLGFALALVIFAGVRERVDAADVPKAFKGIPSTLVAASIVSMSFLGFNGIVEAIFQ